MSGISSFFSSLIPTVDADPNKRATETAKEEEAEAAAPKEKASGGRGGRAGGWQRKFTLNSTSTLSRSCQFELWLASFYFGNFLPCFAWIATLAPLLLSGSAQANSAPRRSACNLGDAPRFTTRVARGQSSHFLAENSAFTLFWPLFFDFSSPVLPDCPEFGIPVYSPYASLAALFVVDAKSLKL
ncbi:hypothetical protein DFH06DRAFT_1128690 [Mycena polygramma]|nr:hypothetical protein DFH06DRAFT_1128690 [Mycena polygramma]